jgi:hypothetical protein
VKGATGATGAAGPTLFKTSGFIFTPISDVGDTELASVTFTPPTGGVALARARGYCNLVGIATQYEAVIVSIDSIVNSTGGDQSNWGVAQTAAADASGSLTVEVFTGTLP